MKRCVLVVLDDNNKTVVQSKYTNIIYKLKNALGRLYSYKMKKEVLKNSDPEIEITNIKINLKNCNNECAVTKLKKVFEWCVDNNIAVMAFDDYLYENYEEIILNNIKDKNLYLCQGNNLYISIILKSIKRLLKTKGIELSKSEVALISNEDSFIEYSLIRSLAPNIKYFTYINNNQNVSDKLIGEIFDPYGLSIRICSELKECVGEVGLLINFGKHKIDENEIRKNNSMVMVDPNNDYSKNCRATILREILIDLNSIIYEADFISNRNKYKLCEMYLLLKMDRLRSLNGDISNMDLFDLYNRFIKEGFRIGTYIGINL